MPLPQSVTGALQVVDSQSGSVYWSSASCGSPDPLIVGTPVKSGPYCPGGGKCAKDNACSGSSYKGLVNGQTCWYGYSPLWTDEYSTVQVTVPDVWGAPTTAQCVANALSPGPFFLYLSDRGSLTINNTYNEMIWAATYDPLIAPYLTSPAPVTEPRQVLGQEIHISSF